MTDDEIVKALNSADVFLRNRANAKLAPLNEYDTEALLDIAKVCDEATSLINRQKAMMEQLEKIVFMDVDAPSATALVAKTEWYRLNSQHIDRLEAEIERLRAMVSQNEGVLSQYEQLIKAAAIKEFAEKLKEKAWIGMWETISHVDVDDIDNLVKEMTSIKDK